jgi:hypothetical protein
VGRKTNEQFINTLREIHGDRFGYEKTKYIKAILPVTLTCLKHNMDFIVNARTAQKKDLCGCDSCREESAKNRRYSNEKYLQKLMQKRPGIEEYYDLSFIDYKKSDRKIDVYCRKHQFMFHPYAGDFLTKKAGCPKCGSGAYTEAEYIEKAILKHNGFYLYMDIKYIDTRSNIEVTCPVHGKFKINAGFHLSGGGCSDCAKIKIGIANGDSKKDWLYKLTKKRKDKGLFYDYTKVVYMGSNVSVEIFCPIHKKYFPQTPAKHLSGQGCPDCSGNVPIETDDFILQSMEIFGEEHFIYDKTEIKGTGTPVIIGCRKHSYFPTYPYNHLKSKTGCCPDCNKENRIGKNNPKYKDGKSKKRTIKRNLDRRYIKWAKIIKQDKQFCDCCGESFTKLNSAHAHHLNSYQYFPKERYDLNNGVALCSECHYKFHGIFGRDWNTKDQYLIFKNDEESTHG